MYMYKTKGTCSSMICIDFDQNDVITSVKFIGGCRGNTQGVAKLAVNRPAKEVADLLRGTLCRGGTSCPDQLAKAIDKYLESK
ncbi:MAG: TIGR03905 family TSCPD domain-containing protein [Clostridia bacterium]|nr:TIGR03905 family TSCPD domain-containing protein [Clostridia bacterium]MBR2495900.1 TIGR03905 family TSCPD domain-containing protein [Clostridia bacterium]MBR2874972.1 TIGR03905 family TSCPD domain-containing protein [Clostridia bacterium]